ncbi:MAG: hypothetical protein Q7K45_07185 [Nanoarchaeota archaeon]|nr:hypothetical protein [Nanoarchaeota archaeon]
MKKKSKPLPAAKVVNLFFMLLIGFVVLNGVALLVVQQQLPSVGQAVKTPFSVQDTSIIIPIIEAEALPSRCVDSDTGVDAKMPGSATYYTGELEGETRFDLCAGTILVERSCQNGKLQSTKIDCASLNLKCLEDTDLKGYCG